MTQPAGSYLHYDDDEIDAPHTVPIHEQPQYGLQSAKTFVPAIAPGSTQARRVDMPAQPQQMIIIPHQGQSEQAIREETTPIQRAVATVISSAFWGLITIPLGLVLVWMTDADPAAI